MKILITGGCGFVGTNLALFLKQKKHKISSLDNLSRKGSKYNLKLLNNEKIKNYRIDIENDRKILKIPKFDLIIDCCAEAAVEVSKNNFEKVINTNLVGTINILKKAKIDKSKIIFLSSSRVYPINSLKDLVDKKKLKKSLKINKMFNENSNINGPKTIYGVTKLASEMFIEEFSYAFKMKYIINRCGVISGPLQFGKQDQGFISLWIWRHLMKKKLSYIGYEGLGNQVRDVLHVNDLSELINIQIKNLNKINNTLFTVGGSKKSYTSLKKLTEICQKITGNKLSISKIKKTSIYDIPYFITDNSKVTRAYGWRPKKNISNIIKDTYKWLKINKSNLIKYF
ncbi:NAD-dependent epimerase/dehydratase family protein [Candidatus Pelagibacter sp.]|nr:NAD-dependent epimerase/dehydratase family protein [Candidatus Pelagibacter bacterium]MDC1082517.1 NAD-dependent epimerase/dehydratase family protein [Candidatus Pelagibacter sp.]